MSVDLQKTLQQIGLSEKETLVYLSCLQLGITTVLHIAQYSELKRPTVYLVLDELGKRGLVSRIQKEKKILFKAEHPERLVAELEMKKTLVSELLPNLQAIYNLNPEKPNIKIREGIQGVRNTYKDIFTYL